MSRVIMFMFLLGLVLNILDASAATSTEQLVTACEKRTRHVERVNGKLEFVGESLDSFCEAYLMSAFELLLAQRAICVKDETPPPRPEYLASVFTTYLDSNRDLRKAPAATVLNEALRRVFVCK